MIIGGVVLGVLLLVNVGLSIYYKQKLGLVSNYAAQYAAGLDPLDPNMGGKTQSQVDSIARSMGIPSVQVTQIDLSNPSFASVTVRMSGLLVGKGDVLPTAVSLTDTGSAPKSSKPMGYYLFQVSHGTNAAPRFGWVPIYREPASGAALWRFEARMTGIMGVTYSTYLEPFHNAGPTTFAY